MTIAFVTIRDLFEGQAARTGLSYVAIVTMVVPMIAPSAGRHCFPLADGAPSMPSLPASACSCF
jgi:hypothetical protein